MIDPAISGLGGIVLGGVLGGTGKYWLLRRDAWREARTSGLLVLADVRALLDGDSTSHLVSETRIGTTTWQKHREVLAGFRRGNFPNGYKAPDWLTLSAHFARLGQIYADRANDSTEGWWTDAEAELVGARGLLDRFENDPPVLGYIVRASLLR